MRKSMVRKKSLLEIFWFNYIARFIQTKQPTNPKLGKRVLHTLADYNLKLLRIQILHIYIFSYYIGYSLYLYIYIHFFHHTSELHQTVHIFWSLLSTGFYNGMHLGTPRCGATLLPTSCQAHIIQIPCSVPPMRCRLNWWYEQQKLKLQNNYGKTAPISNLAQKIIQKESLANHSSNIKSVCEMNSARKLERRKVFNLTSITPDLKSRSIGLILATKLLLRSWAIWATLI